MWWNSRMEQNCNCFHHQSPSTSRWMRRGEDWAIFSSARHALAVTEHAAGVSPLPAVTTSGATSRVFHLAFVHLSLSPALAMDAPAEEESSRCLGRWISHIGFVGWAKWQCLVQNENHAQKVVPILIAGDELEWSTWMHRYKDFFCCF
jgi:hypothetical protein